MAKQKKPRDLKGGKARATKLTSEQRREQARKAAQARWHKNNRPGQPGEYREAVGHGLSATEKVMVRKSINGWVVFGMAVATISLFLLVYAWGRYAEIGDEMDAITEATEDVVRAADLLGELGAPGAAVRLLEQNYLDVERGRVLFDQLYAERGKFNLLRVVAFGGIIGGLYITVKAERRKR